MSGCLARILSRASQMRVTSLQSVPPVNPRQVRKLPSCASGRAGARWKVASGGLAPRPPPAILGMASYGDAV
jgi:hypothetical protein